MNAARRVKGGHKGGPAGGGGRRGGLFIRVGGRRSEIASSKCEQVTATAGNLKHCLTANERQVGVEGPEGGGGAGGVGGGRGGLLTIM